MWFCFSPYCSASWNQYYGTGTGEVHRCFTYVLKGLVLCSSAHHNQTMTSKFCSIFFLCASLWQHQPSYKNSLVLWAYIQYHVLHTVTVHPDICKSTLQQHNLLTKLSKWNQGDFSNPSRAALWCKWVWLPLIAICQKSLRILKMPPK